MRLGSRGRSRTQPLFFLIVLVVLTLLAGGKAAAGHKGILALVYENDLFAERDQYYTSGFRVNWFTPSRSVPGWIASSVDGVGLYAPEAHHRIGYSLGQNMYTPRDISDPDPDAGDRPYAGWSYGSVVLIQDRGDRLDTLEFMAGVVGPSSQAGDVQREIHQVVGSDIPRGWDHQLHDEVGLRLTYGVRDIAWAETTLGGLDFEVWPGYCLTLGNVLTAAEVSTVLRWGRVPLRDYGPPLIRTGPPGAGFFVPGRYFTWYTYLHLSARTVARDLFLDGNTIQNSPSVDREEVIGEAQLGLVLTWPSFRVSYTHVFPTREFEEQTETHHYGALTFSTRF